MRKRQLMHSNVKSVENIYRHNNNHKTCTNKALSFFLVPIWRFQHFKYILQNPKLKQNATGFSTHSLDLYLSHNNNNNNRGKPGKSNIFMNG